MSRTKNAARNIIWGILNKVIVIALPFIIRTVMIYTLGTLYLGLNGLFTSILHVLNISELGVSSAITFSMYKPLAEGKTEEVRALMNFYRKCYRIIGIIVLTLGIALLPFLDNFISGEVPADINIHILYLINLGSTVLSYELFAYRSSLLVASQRNDIVSKVASVCAVIQFSFQMLVLLLFKNYYLYVIVIVCNTIVNNIICAIICKRIYPQYYCEGNVSDEDLEKIRIKIGGMVFQKIGGVVLSSVDMIVISAFLGLNILAVYQNYYYIITSLFTVLAVIMRSIIASIGNSIALESVQKNYSDFKKFNFIYIWLISWCTVCLLCLYQPFMEIWVGKELMLSDGFVVLFVAYFFVHKWCDMLFVYQEACGIWWETKFVPLIAAMVNLVVNLILINFIGLAGILISTIVSVIFIYDIGYAKVLFKCYFKEYGYIKEYIFRQLFYFGTTVLACVITVFVCEILKVDSLFWQMVVNGMVCVLLPNIIFVSFWHKFPEFNASVKFAKAIVKKKMIK